jgi:phosphoribosylformylglycinamidine cyclo-ligase
LVLGARPFIFLDYYACGKLDADKASKVIDGISKGCEIAGCALIGGETAEMPGMYNGDDFDLAGFAVGLVERKQLIDGKNIKAGDVLLGLGSSGCHSNGYSLIRKILKDDNYSFFDPAPFEPEQSVAESFLTPTRIYCSSIAKALESSAPIKGIAHITGGGLIENIPRILPDNVCVELDAQQWECGRETKWLCETARLSYDDGLRTFNCGIGLIIVCSKEKASDIKNLLEIEGEAVYQVGDVTSKENSEENIISVKNKESLWSVKS